MTLRTFLGTSFLAVLSFAGSSYAHAAPECRFERTLGVGSKGSLNAGTGSGDLRVVSGDGAHVHILGHVRAANTFSFFGGSSSSSQADVQRICDHPPIDQSGSDVRVGDPHNNGDWYRHVSVDYVIEVPRAFTVTANSGSGNLELRGLGAAVNGTTGSGDIRAGGLVAGARLHTGSGNIEAGDLGGAVNLETGSGDIRARFNAPGDAHASTGSGGIHLDNVLGAANAHTGSGDVEIAGKPTTLWHVGTGSGTVRLHIPRDAGFLLDAETSSGDINTTLPITQQGSLGKHHIRGSVSGGGPEVRVETSSGDIQVD